MKAKSPIRSLDQSRELKPEFRIDESFSPSEENKSAAKPGVDSNRDSSVVDDSFIRAKVQPKHSKKESSRYSRLEDDLGTPQNLSSGAELPVLDVAIADASVEGMFSDIIETQLVIPPDPEEQKAKTFVTEAKVEEKQVEQNFLVNDLLFPGGKVSKLVRVSNYRSREVKLGDIVTRLKLNDSYPAILLSGAEGDTRGRVLVGLVRAAYSTDAVIYGTGLKSGIEQAAYKRKVNYIGICPEDLIVYPTKASRGDRLGELAAGYSHFMVLGTKGDFTRWDSIVQFKMDLINRLLKGRGGPGSYKCRGVCVVAGDNTNCLREVESVLKAGWPVIALESSPLGSQIAGIRSGSGGQSLPPAFVEAVKKGRVFLFPESGTAEHLASAVHLHLAVTF